MEILKAILQGIVQGITEWLPISSTGHLILLNEFLPFRLSDNFFNLFKVLIQLGSILAVVVLYFNKLNPFSPKKTAAQKKSTWLIWRNVVVACIPVAIVGLPLNSNSVIDDYLSVPAVIAGMLILYGILFLWMESRNHTPRIHSFDQMNWKAALVIGCFQTLALIPGTSRSGATIFGAVLIGCSRYVSTEFSFFLSIPTMLGASGLKTVEYLFVNKYTFTATEWIVLLVGMATAFVVSLFAIRLLVGFVKKHDFKPFGWYRIALGAVIILLLLTGVLTNKVVSA